MQLPASTKPRHSEHNVLSPRGLGQDFMAGVAVLLVAIPLCLGIALASDAPLFSGIVAGVVGGLVVGVISGSHTSVSGPAAGLTAVVAAQIATLGSFEAFLLAVMLAGAIQVVLGVVRAGSIADFIPSSVIKGLLAAIGLILILKQVPHLFGHDADPPGEMSFQQVDQENTLSELANVAGALHYGAALLGLVSLLFLLLWPRTSLGKSSKVPPSLIVVLLGLATGELFRMLGWGASWVIGPDHLVQVPVTEGLAGFFTLFSLPNFAAASMAIVPAGVTLALVASLETLLNLEAIDKLDPHKRISNPNRELVAQGVGNLTAGLIGGLPVTSVIVRGSVNIHAGARTKRSTIIHGALLLLVVALFPTVINRIPLASLAAILIATGIKLASPSLARSMWRRGWSTFIPFITTVVAIIVTDLLIGILIGLAVAAAFILRNNYKDSVRRVMERHVTGFVLRIELGEQATFLSRSGLSKALNQVEPGSHVLIDARKTTTVDPDVLNLLLEFKEDVAPARDIKVSTVGLGDHHGVDDRIQFVDYSTRELQDSMTPGQVVDILREGNERFRTGRALIRDVARQREITATAQHPLAVVLTGTSSRTPVEAIFDVGLGDISCARSTGSSVGDAVLASLEYAVGVDCVKLIAVMGHTGNDAIRLAVEAQLGEASRDLPPSVQKLLRDAHVALTPEQLELWPRLDETERARLVDELANQHVRYTMARILETSELIAKRVAAGELKVVGCMYDAKTGRVTFDEDARLAQGDGQAT